MTFPVERGRPPMTWPMDVAFLFAGFVLPARDRLSV